jgi:hypothetical protein
LRASGKKQVTVICFRLVAAGDSQFHPAIPLFFSVQGKAVGIELILIAQGILRKRIALLQEPRMQPLGHLIELNMPIIHAAVQPGVKGEKKGGNDTHEQ